MGSGVSSGVGSTVGSGVVVTAGSAVGSGVAVNTGSDVGFILSSASLPSTVLISVTFVSGTSVTILSSFSSLDITITSLSMSSSGTSVTLRLPRPSSSSGSALLHAVNTRHRHSMIANNLNNLFFIFPILSLCKCIFLFLHTFDERNLKQVPSKK